MALKDENGLILQITSLQSNQWLKNAISAQIISAVGGGAITFKQETRHHFGHCFLPVQLLLPIMTSAI